jgi:hypothetical protein
MAIGTGGTTTKPDSFESGFLFLDVSLVLPIAPKIRISLKKILQNINNKRFAVSIVSLILVIAQQS